MGKEREVPIRIIVRKKGHAAHHGGAWKVAFADFMTAMFAMFLVLWLINQSSDVKSAIAGYFQDPLGRADEFGSSILPGDGAQASTARPLTQTDVVDLRHARLQNAAMQIQDHLAEVPELKEVSEFINLAITDEGLRIELIEDAVGLFFESGSAKPSERGKSILAVIGNEIGGLPNEVVIAGHTDARPYLGSRVYTNWELSADRANVARRVLVENGLSPLQVASIRGHADRELRDPTQPFSPTNRRITITVLLPNEPPGEPQTVSEVAMP